MKQLKNNLWLRKKIVTASKFYTFSAWIAIYFLFLLMEEKIGNTLFFKKILKIFIGRLPPFWDMAGKQHSLGYWQ